MAGGRSWRPADRKEPKPKRLQTSTPEEICKTPTDTKILVVNAYPQQPPYSLHG